jgi:hypothetical protein
MLVIDPAGRLDIASCLRHPYFINAPKDHLAKDRYNIKPVDIPDDDLRIDLPEPHDDWKKAGARRNGNNNGNEEKREINKNPAPHDTQEGEGVWMGPAIFEAKKDHHKKGGKQQKNIPSSTSSTAAVSATPPTTSSSATRTPTGFGRGGIRRDEKQHVIATGRQPVSTTNVTAASSSSSSSVAAVSSTSTSTTSAPAAAPTVTPTPAKQQGQQQQGGRGGGNGHRGGRGGHRGRR